MSGFRRGRGTSDNQYMAKQMFRLICNKGKTAVVVHIDYSSAFDSMSHIYLFNALRKAGASLKTLQLYKAIYGNAKVVVKINGEESKSIGVGRGQLEGDVTSPMLFNVGLEQVFREADEINSAVASPVGINVGDITITRTGFADDVQLWSTEGVDRLSTIAQNVEIVSENAGLTINALKSYGQHIGRHAEAPAVTTDDIAALEPAHACPVPWCTRRFGTKAEMRGHALWHKGQKDSIMDQTELALGMVLGARGPPEHRYYLVGWMDGRFKWLGHQHFQETTQFMVEQFFLVNFFLDRNCDLKVPWEHRCIQCNEFLKSAEELQSHIQQCHTHPIKRGSVLYRRAVNAVRQKHQQGLPTPARQGAVQQVQSKAARDGPISNGQ